MNLYTVTTTIPTNKGLFVWFPFECDLTLDEIAEALADEGLVQIEQLQVRHFDDGTAKITERKPMILGRNAVATIQPYHLTIAERRS